MLPESPIPAEAVTFDKGDTSWMIVATALVLLMTPGLGFFYGGMVGKKNVISTMLQSYTAMIIVTILWVFVGFSLSFGSSIGGIVGNPTDYFMFHDVTVRTAWGTIPLCYLLCFRQNLRLLRQHW